MKCINFYTGSEWWCGGVVNTIGEVFTDHSFLSPILIEIMNLLEQGLVWQLKRGGSLTTDRIGEVFTDRGFLSPFLLGGGQEILNLLQQGLGQEWGGGKVRDHWQDRGGIYWPWVSFPLSPWRRPGDRESSHCRSQRTKSPHWSSPVIKLTEITNKHWLVNIA